MLGVVRLCFHLSAGSIDVVNSLLMNYCIFIALLSCVGASFFESGMALVLLGHSESDMSLHLSYIALDPCHVFFILLCSASILAFLFLEGNPGNVGLSPFYFTATDPIHVTSPLVTIEGLMAFISISPVGFG
ncbi:hypothetical protein Tco_0373251 [Tanacetum coccineum]